MDIQEKMWISFNGEPMYVDTIDDDVDDVILLSTTGKELKVSLNESFEPIEVPIFQKGQSVLCIDKESSCYQQVVTILSTVTDTFVNYQLTPEQWATPFDIIPIDY